MKRAMVRVVCVSLMLMYRCSRIEIPPHQCVGPVPIKTVCLSALRSNVVVRYVDPLLRCLALLALGHSIKLQH